MKRTAQIAGLAAALLAFSGTAAEAAVYTVIPGDSLFKISLKQNTTVSDLMQTNKLSSTTLYPGQKLTIPGIYPYTVQNNESMWDISQRTGVPLDRLISANPQIADVNNIWNGLTLYIPYATQDQALAARPSLFTDGRFPLAKGTYQSPLENNFMDERTWSASGASVRTHEGVDIFAAQGTPIYSVLDGEIINFGWNEYGGWRVTLRTDSSTVFYYAHLSRYAPGIGKGSIIKKGQLLGYVGSTGYGPAGTSGKFLPHLHFAIYRTNAPSWQAIDPFPYLQWWERNNS